MARPGTPHRIKVNPNNKVETTLYIREKSVTASTSSSKRTLKFALLQ